MKGYPPYVAKLAPFEGRRINLTDLRPVIPQHRIGRDAWYAPKGWWERRHREKLAEIAAGPKEYDMVFVGDSITHNWEGWRNPDEAKFIDALHDNDKGRLKNGSRPAAGTWDAMAAKYRLLNLGYGGDRTQNVLWRIANGEMDGYRAKNVMLMIGTNNPERPDAVVNGVKAVLEAIRAKQSSARILLSPIFPRQASPKHPQRVRNDGINRKLQEFADGDKIVWLDFNAKFLTKDGVLTRELFPDLLHPVAEGYRFWLDAIAPYLAK
jgi:beta-glucosidase